MPNRIEARSAKAALTNATGRLPLPRLFSTPLIYREENSLPLAHLCNGRFQQLGKLNESEKGTGSLKHG